MGISDSSLRPPALLLLFAFEGTSGINLETFQRLCHKFSTVARKKTKIAFLHLLDIVRLPWISKEMFFSFAFKRNVTANATVFPPATFFSRFSDANESRCYFFSPCSLS